MTASGKLLHGQRIVIMKVKKLILKLHQAAVTHNTKKEKKIWFKLLKKSLKHKHTEAVK
jgi:hypothetical protein